MRWPRDANVVTRHRIVQRYRAEGRGTQRVLGYNECLAAVPAAAGRFFREQRIRRMNLQLLRHGIGTRAASKAAGYLLAVWMVGAGLGAWAQVATRTHVSVAAEAF